MSNHGGFERGIIKTLVIITLALCGAFIVLALLTRTLGGLGKGAFDTISNLAPATPTSVEVRTNPLLDFGNPYVDPEDSRLSSGTTKFDSPYAGRITLSTGSASYTIQPMDEYIELRNSGDAPVDITGWVLENGKGTRPTEAPYNSYFYQSPDRAIIGQGTEFLDPSGYFKTGHIVLKPDDLAYVTTGGPFSQFSFSINTSFRENECLGYLDVYPFEPSVGMECPYASDDKDVRMVTDQCYDYLKSLNRCEDPERDDKANFDMQTSICKNFMRERFTYPSCVARHRYDKDFSSNIWRIFLGKKMELWASQRETITLYDAQGRVVDRETY